ncbi:MAG: hypothetical protein H0W81_11945 [Chloroflexi bacterium]|nr:hypothetical protein [Chloroflexota bacterium]
MTTHEARRLVIDHLEQAGAAVYELRLRYGLPSIGQLVVMDTATGGAQVVRVLVGKRPGGSRSLYYDKRRVGRCDLVALVDPDDGSIRLTPSSSAAEGVTGV